MPVRRHAGDATSESDYAPGSVYADSSTEESQSDEDVDLGSELDAEELTSSDSDPDGSRVELPVDPDLIDKIQADRDDIAIVEDAMLQFNIDNPDHGWDAPNSDEEAEPELFNGNLAPPEFYRHNMKTLNVDDFRKKDYAEGTLKLIDNAENYWRSFCSDILRSKDWEVCLKKIDFHRVYNFLLWYCNQTTGRKGQRKRRVKKIGSLVTFWCCFRLSYERLTNQKIDHALPRDVMSNALAALGKTAKLDNEKRENRSMTLEDLKLQIETTLCTTSKDFKLGELRILAVLFLLLLAPQGSRPQSILNIRFKDIDILLIRDPENPGGPPRLTIRLRLVMTKTYRGPKSIKTFLVPEILFDPSLLLSPHVFLLAVLCHNRAFTNEELNDNPDTIKTLKIRPNSNQLCLALKRDIMEVPLFRQSVPTPTGYRMSTTKQITSAITNKWIKTVGELLGFKDNTIAYGLRYFAGNSMDQSVDVSSALRNLVLDHAPNSDTFQKHYLNRNVCADLWAIHRDLNPQQALIRQATSHGGSRDSRRVFKLTDAQLEEVKQDPRYVRLTKAIESIRDRTSPKRKEFTRKRKNLYAELKDKMLRRIRAEWTEKQAIEDVARQMRGEDITMDDSTADDNARPMTIVQQRMFDALTAPLVNNIEAQFQRRTGAIVALMAYCGEEEPLRTKVLEARKPKPPPELQSQGLAPEEQLRQILRSVLVSAAGPKIRRCFICVFKACSLGRDHMRFDDLCREFYNPHVLARHFISVHLDGMAPYDSFECPNCRTTLVDKNHLRLHAEDIHGIKTSRKRKMRYIGE